MKLLVCMSAPLSENDGERGEKGGWEGIDESHSTSRNGLLGYVDRGGQSDKTSIFGDDVQEGVDSASDR